MVGIYQCKGCSMKTCYAVTSIADLRDNNENCIADKYEVANWEEITLEYFKKIIALA